MTRHVDYRELPLVYSCSGCSSAAQLANHLALRLDREQRAEMSCIAGVGGDVKPLLKMAASGRRIVALDGCPLHCVLHCLRRHGVQPTLHYTLSDMGVRKQYHADFDLLDAARIFETLRVDLANAAIDSSRAS